MKNPLIRMVLYCSVFLLLFYTENLNFLRLCVLTFAFVIVELRLGSKDEYVSTNNLVKVSYWLLFLITGTILIFNREAILNN
jgi:hypothetical protein